MAVECCTRCDNYVDLDWNVDEIAYISGLAVCANCWTDGEFEYLAENMTQEATREEITAYFDQKPDTEPDPDLINKGRQEDAAAAEDDRAES